MENARRKRRQKHGGNHRRLDLDASCLIDEHRAAQILSLERALTKLQAESPRQAELVSLRYFAGLSHQQAAKALGISRATADRDWAYAKVFLHCEMEDDGNDA